jgi:kumamolisin
MAAIILCATIASQAQSQTLLTHHVRQVVLNGQAKSLGRLPATQSLHFDIVLPLRDQAGLESFLRAVYDPSSSSYRHFLTVEDFTARFGPSQQDYNALIHFATASGFTVLGGSRDSMDVQLKGSVSAIEAAFHVKMNVYQHPTEDRTFYAPDREPSVDLSIQLWHISGLDNYSIPRPALQRRSPQGVRSNATTGSCPGQSFCGSDMRAAYYESTALTGSGQNVGLLEYLGFDIADVNTYYKNANQTRTAAVVGISTDGSSLSCLASQGCDDTEQTLDITQSAGMAPGVTTVYVFVGNTDTALLGGMSSDTPLPLNLSSSWTWSPADPKTDDPYFQKMQAQGQSFFQAAGDSDSWNKNNDLYPSEDPNVICVGGTDLNTTGPGGDWASEVGWVDGGGGISPDKLAIPSWQQLPGVITSANKGSTLYRNGPDVSANSNFTFYVCADQTTCSENLYGGTSFAAPMWAGYLALANQQAASNGNPPPGFINPVIYPLGLGSDYDTDFHDITSGNNGFPATIGYDLDTGWGSPNGASLINALVGTSVPSFALSSSPGSITVKQGSSGTSTITSTVFSGFDSTVNLTASGQPSGVTATLKPTSITGDGTSTLTLAVASTTAAGVYPITITGVGGGLTETTTGTLTVNATGSFTIAANPSSITIAQGSSGTTSIVVTPSGGFDAAVTLSGGGKPATYSPNPIPAGSTTSTMTIVVGKQITVGTHSIVVTGASGSLSETATITVTVIK